MQYPIIKPALVNEALSLAERLGFDIRPEGNLPINENTTPSCCIDAVGSLLQTLSAVAGHKLIGEVGTGAGVGTAWLAAGKQPATQLITVELDADLHSAVSELFVNESGITALCGDWRAEFKSYAPFDLLFADGGGIGATHESDWKEAANLVAAGGIMVIDDLTPEALWPDAWRGKPDLKREFAFNSGFFTATEVRTSEQTSALVMVRK